MSRQLQRLAKQSRMTDYIQCSLNWQVKSKKKAKKGPELLKEDPGQKAFSYKLKAEGMDYYLGLVAWIRVWVATGSGAGTGSRIYFSLRSDYHVEKVVDVKLSESTESFNLIGVRSGLLF